MHPSVSMELAGARSGGSLRGVSSGFQGRAKWPGFSDYLHAIERDYLAIVVIIAGIESEVSIFHINPAWFRIIPICPNVRVS
jgi:hypothetical protein